MPLVTMIRDPGAWPHPHTAEVPPSEVPNFVKHGGWHVLDLGNGRELDEAPKPGGNIAILCAGQSLEQTWPDGRRKFSAVIGVNKAGAYQAVDWWFGLDGPIWYHYPNALVPRVGYAGCVYQLLGRMGDGVSGNLKLVEAHDAPGCQSFSGPAAVHFAFSKLDANKVTCFGVDLEGDIGWGGETGHDPTGTRWPDEIASWEILRARHGKALQFVGGRYGQKGNA